MLAGGVVVGLARARRARAVLVTVADVGAVTTDKAPPKVVPPAPKPKQLVSRPPLLGELRRQPAAHARRGSIKLGRAGEVGVGAGPRTT